MSSQITPLSPDVQAEAFPRLTPEQISRNPSIEQGTAGGKSGATFLFRAGGTVEVPFFVAALGQHGNCAAGPPLAERTIVSHEAGGFTGEMTTLSGPARPGPWPGLRRPGEFLEISNHGSENAGSQETPNLSEIFMRAFHLAAGVALIDRPPGKT